MEPDFEYDNIKIYHFVVAPDGEELWADISPYLYDKEAVELWIDAGYPTRIANGQLRKYQIISLIGDKEKRQTKAQSRKHG